MNENGLIRINKYNYKKLTFGIQSLDDNTDVANVTGYSLYFLICNADGTEMLKKINGTASSDNKSFIVEIESSDTADLQCGNYLWQTVVVYPNNLIESYKGSFIIDKGIEASWIQ